MPNNWHPILPTSKRAKLILRHHADCSNVLCVFGQHPQDQILYRDGSTSATNRFIIGTIAAKLCREMESKHLTTNFDLHQKWHNTAFEWDLWAEGKDWQS